MSPREAHARGDTIPGSRYISGRGAALGDAFIGLADDGASGLFYNPAAIARVRQPHFEPLNFQLQLNSDYIRMIDRSFFKAPSLSSYMPNLIRKPDMFPGGTASLFPNFAFRGFAFGVLWQSRLSAQARDGNVRYRSKYQFIPTVGGGIRLASGVVRLGYSLQWVNQGSGDVTVPQSDPNIGYNEYLAQGSAVSHNLGFALTLPVSYLPSLNIVARNVLGAKFGTFSLMPLARNTQGELPEEPMSIDAAVSVSPKAGNGTFFNLSLEYRDVTNVSQISLLGRLALGIEFSVRDHFFLRGGWGSGYPSAGLGLRRKTAEFAFSWFSEELGTSYKEWRDVRYMLHYQVRAF